MLDVWDQLVYNIISKINQSAAEKKHTTSYIVEKIFFVAKEGDNGDETLMMMCGVKCGLPPLCSCDQKL